MMHLGLHLTIFEVPSNNLQLSVCTDLKGCDVLLLARDSVARLAGRNHATSLRFAAQRFMQQRLFENRRIN
jgi:hypothetical protein